MNSLFHFVLYLSDQLKPDYLSCVSSSKTWSKTKT